MALKFGDTSSTKMINQVMRKANETDMDHKKRDISLDLIDLNPDNEYIFGYDDIDFLATEINDSGFHGAIEVYVKEDGRYEIASGHRRYLACKKNGYKTIPCIVSEYKGDAVLAEQLIMSNIHQRDLSPLRLARAIQYYENNVLKEKKVDYQGRKRAYLAGKFNMSETAIQRYQGILKLIPELQELCDDKGFPFSYYTTPIGISRRAIAQESPERQKEVYEALLAIAPEGKISELSKRAIEMQFESVLEKENRKNISRIKETESKKEVIVQEDDADATDVSFPQEEQMTEENSGIIKYNFDDGNGEIESVNVFQPETAAYQELPDLDQKDEISVADDRVLFYINKINEIIASNAVYADKAKVIDQLRDTLNRLEN